MTSPTARSLIAYLGGLTLAGGDHDGEAFDVLPWERRFIRGTFSVDGPAAMSVARGNGKSALVAGLAAAVVDPAGPLHGTRHEVVCVASSFDQAHGTIFEDVLSFLRQRYDLTHRATWRVQDSANRATVEHRPSGARVRCIGSDPTKAHGLRPYMALLDEPSQWDPAKQERMLNAIRTGLGKVPGSRMIALGTLPPRSGHWFARMIAGGAAYAQCHAARPADPPFTLRTIRRANPSVDHLPSLLAKIREEGAEARQDESLLAAYKALRLNMGTSDSVDATLLEAETWARIEGDAPPEGRPIYGIDLGTTAAMSAVAAFWPETGRLDVLSAFPAEGGLAERGLRDGVGRMYLEGQRRGELILAGGAAVSVHELLAAALARFGRPSAVASDRWREGELRDCLKAAGVPVARLELRGMGYRDGGEDVRSFRRWCLEGKVTPVRSLILANAVAEARVVTDDAGNQKLSKNAGGGRRLRARDDACAAAILAVGCAARRPSRARGRYLGKATAS